RLERRGMKIVAMKMLRMDVEMAKRHYAVHEGKPFFMELIEYITSGPVVAMVVAGEQAVSVVRQTMGATDPSKAGAGTIRGDLALTIRYNVVHGSDSVETAIKEINLFFRPDEILDYKRDIDGWIGGF
ncbi:MAG: nucleoside-diphosphate kinase, partial [Dehalococcoidia bacterium]|nr:nucleoside-diphosphate kinase [Dehalococcoidia bacterium]